MPYLLQPDSGGNCCDCPDRETPCEDCAPCPRDITDISSITVETTLEVTDTRASCTFSFTQTISRTWNRVNRFDGAGNFVSEPGILEFQIWRDTQESGCDAFHIKTGDPAGSSEGEGFRNDLGLRDYGSCTTPSGSGCTGYTDTLFGPDGSTTSAGTALATIEDGGDFFSGNNFVLNIFTSYNLSCVRVGGTGTCGSSCASSNEYDETGMGGVATLAELIGTWMADHTFTATGYSAHLRTVVTIA